MLPLLDTVEEYGKDTGLYIGDNNCTFFIEDPFILLGTNDISKLMNNKHVIGIYKHNIKDFQYSYVCVLKVPYMYKDDYNLFVQGKYSKLSDRAKLVIKNKWKALAGDKVSFLNRVENVLSKSGKLKDVLYYLQKSDSIDYKSEYANQALWNSIDELAPKPDNEVISIYDIDFNTDLNVRESI